MQDKNKKKSPKWFILALILFGIILVGGFFLILLFINEDGTPEAIIITAPTAPKNITSTTYDSTTDNDGLTAYLTDAENIVIDPETETRYVNNELLLTVNNGVAESDVEAFISIHSAKIVGYDMYLKKYQILLSSEYTLNELEDIRDEFSQSKLFTNVRINLAFEAESASYTPNDNKWQDEWNNPAGSAWGALAIHAPEMWASYNVLTKNPINVGVLDNQFYTEHEDLTFAESPYYNSFNPELEATEQPNHGTHVAGIIAANFDNGMGIAGIAPRVNLYAASINGLNDRDYKYNSPKDPNDIITVSNTEAGLTYLVCLKRCRVVNYSYQIKARSQKDKTEISQQLTDAILTYTGEIDDVDEGMEKFDFVIVKAAGNDGSNIDEDRNKDALSMIEDEKAKEHIIVVGAVERPIDGTMRVWGYSNYGTRVDLVAPGTNIYSTVHNLSSSSDKHSDYSNTFDFYGENRDYSGTSMAAPHVSGVAAAMWSVRPDLTGAEIKSIICRTATDEYYGYEDQNITDRYRMLDAYEAVRGAVEYMRAPSTGVQPTLGEAITSLPGMPLEFTLSSGVGAWGTYVTVNSDGTFSGRYSDDDMGVTGSDYPNGTRHECVFSGNFANFQKISEYEYFMKVESINIEGTLNEERIVDGLKIITSDGSRLAVGDEVRLYLPGISTEILPAPYIEWVDAPLGWMSEIPSFLPFYGMYNVNNECGYRSENGSSDFIGVSEYQEMNKFLNTFYGYNQSLSDIKTDYDYISFASGKARENIIGDYSDTSIIEPDGGVMIPATNIENILSRYFGIETVNHQGYGYEFRQDIPELWWGYKNGYYRDIGSDGPDILCWPNVKSIFQNSDGATLTVNIDEYKAHASIQPENWYDFVDNWVLPSNAKGIEQHSSDDYYISQDNSISIVIAPSDDYYKIIEINRIPVPKSLFPSLSVP